MYKHRITFTGSWLILTLALILFPGFECRGFFMGQIISCWPVMVVSQYFNGLLRCENGLIISLPTLSGLTVFLCSWLIDKAKISWKIQLLLLLSIFGGAWFSATPAISYSAWQNTPAISAAMESPEVNYQPTHRDFYESIVVPRILAGGMIGLYITTTLITLIANGVLLKRKCSTSARN
jgi:hypothetical protein